MAHILVVEDEQHLSKLVKFNLEAEGYRVTVAGDGHAALKCLEENPDGVDLVILDLMLPGMSGYTVCETLRDSGRDMPVLILSARTLTEDRTRGFDVGADQYLMKPFELEELLSRVKNLLALYARRAERSINKWTALTTFEFGTAKIDFETYEVTVDGEPIRLTQLELKLLQYFVENEGRVVSRYDLLENVWDMPGTLSTRAPDQFIRRLRKAFEPDPAKPRHFLTIRDAGYRFVASGETS
jgi:two-component system alkaline phosphatase synthesis response regulator PhoP